MLVASVVFSDEGHNVPLLSRGEGLMMPTLLEILASSGPGRPNPRPRQAIRSSTQRATQAPAASEYDKPLFQRPELWNSIMQTGLGMLAGSSDFGATGLSSFGKAASQFGLPAYQQGRRRAAISDAMTGAPEAMQRLMSIDPELAMQMRGGASDPRIMSGPNGAIYRIGATGDPELVVAGVPDEPNLTDQQWEFEEYRKVNPNANIVEFREWLKSLEPEDERSYTADEQKRLQYQNMLTTPLDGYGQSIADMLNSFDPPTRMDQTITDYFRSFSDQEQRQREALESVFADAVLRIATGATATQSEIDEVRNRYFPRVNDDHATVRMKAALRASWLRSLTAGM